MAIFKLRSLLSAVALINFSSTQIWNSLGCYTVTSDREMLTQVNTQGQLITPEICQTTCGDLGFTMAGVEKGVECWCSNLFETGSPSTACTVPCNGDSTQVCDVEESVSLPKPHENFTKMPGFPWNNLPANADSDAIRCAVEMVESIFMKYNSHQWRARRAWIH
jgi:hypothetical protein